MGLTTRTVRGDKAERLLLLVHGLGADENDLAQLVPHLDPEGHFLAVLPRGQYAAPPGYSWFKFDSPALTASTLRSSIDGVEEVVQETLDLHGFRREEAVFGGFSQGAALTLTMGLRESDQTKPAGILAMSGFAPVRDGLDFAGAPPVLMQHGSSDPLIPVARAKESAEFLRDNGVPLVYREYPMEHQVTIDSIRDAAEWLTDVRQGKKPSGIWAEVQAPPADDNALVKPVSSAAFDAEVLQSTKPVIVDFWAPWCGPCRAVAPVVEQIAAMRGATYKVVKVNIDEAPDIAQRYNVQSIPLVALFRNGRLERQSLGAKARPQLEAELGMLVIP